MSTNPPTDAEIAAAALGDTKPRILVVESDPAATVERMAKVLAATGAMFDRGIPVKVVRDGQTGILTLHPLKAPAVVLEVGRASQPYVVKGGRNGPFEADCAIPKDLAAMFLEDRGNWGFPSIDGIASAPLLSADGGIRSAGGYDPATRMYCDAIPDLEGMVPVRPTRADAEAALMLIRRRFSTFAFADSPMHEGTDGVARVRVDLAPGADESAFLNALLTAICRPSLALAPALAVHAAGVSGSGSGKGLLVTGICLIAFGHQPAAIPPGAAGSGEFEKRIETALIQGGSAVLLDNLNGIALHSNALDAALTQSPAQIRKMGVNELLTINAKAFIAATGNGLLISEDSARRFLRVCLDARVESPELRDFPGDFASEVRGDRRTLLAAALTIWRWGRVAGSEVKRGAALGSYGEWSRWVRDPLLTLGCTDPARRVAEVKASDPKREHLIAVFEAWWEAHGSEPMFATKLAETVQNLLVEVGGTRQKVAGAVGKLAGTRVGGFALSRSREGDAIKYALTRGGMEGAVSRADLEAGASALDELNALLASS